MKKIKLVIFLNIVTIFSALGQTGLPPAYQIISDTATHNISLPDSNWQMMADPSGKLTLQQVLQSGNFQDTDTKINYHILTYWLRCCYINKTQQDVNMAFYAGTTAQTDLYLSIDGGNWQHLKSGLKVPWSERDGLKRTYSITNTLPAGKEMIVYKRDQFDYVFNIPSQREEMGFNFTRNVIKQHYTANNQYAFVILLVALLLGILLLAVVINLFFFGVVREKEYLYFALFLLASIIFGPVSALRDFILKENPELVLYSSFVGGALYLFLFIHFIRYLLKTFKAFPRWDKYLIALSIVQVIASLVTAFGSSILQTNLSGLSQYIYDGATMGLALSVLITCFLYVQRKERSVWAMIIAVIPLMAFFLLSTGTSFIITIFYSHSAVPTFIPAILRQEDLITLVTSICYLWMIIIFSWLLIRRFSLIRKKLAQQEIEKEKERSAFIEQQKTELEKQVTERTSELKQSLSNLKATQKQLIQSEKMASLGELTAGIAHEIQNPLNFVNNFSEINKELIDEMQQEMDNGNLVDAKEISNEIKENAEKINHHGKRAAGIVKGMLQHSRVSTGVKEPTDINALCDEYLRLSYHGSRAKDKSSNATMKTDFDETIGKINIIPQDMGRVLLNLFNNAFYACIERSRSTVKEQKSKNLISYEPTVSVTTKKSENHVVITVSDNGNGIPQNIVDKIFQPFFTTKPTGQGTGLGLSLSYDIVKAAGGEIKVDTNEGEGAEFIIQLPVV